MELLSNEKFTDIYTNEAFRNQIAYAHECCNEKGIFLHWQACCYPLHYQVTEQQIIEAAWELERARERAAKKNRKNLVLIGMVMTYPQRYPDDVCNYRVRGYFKNIFGRSFMIEFSTGTGANDFYIPAAEDLTKEIQLGQRSHARQMEFRNYKNLELLGKTLGPYTKANLLDIVNTYFRCHFEELVVDNYTLSIKEHVSVSPKRAKGRQRHTGH